MTKEDTVLRLDCWRVLTELDAKAREARTGEDKEKELVFNAIIAVKTCAIQIFFVYS